MDTDSPWRVWAGYLCWMVAGAAAVSLTTPPVVPQMPVAPAVAVERPVLPMPSLEPPAVCVEREPIPYPVQAVSVRWRD
jgi:hypothetical protein